MDKFSKIDALLPLFFDKHNKLTVSIDELKKTMKKNNIKLPSNIKQWNKIIGVKPKFENIQYLLENHEFLQTLNGNVVHGVELAIRLDNLSMFKFYDKSFEFTLKFFTKSCNLNSKNIIIYMLDIHNDTYHNDNEDDISYFNSFLNILLDNMNPNVNDEIRDLIYTKIKNIVEKTPNQSFLKILDIAKIKRRGDSYSWRYNWGYNRDDTRDLSEDIDIEGE